MRKAKFAASVKKVKLARDIHDEMQKCMNSRMTRMTPMDPTRDNDEMFAIGE